MTALSKRRKEIVSGVDKETLYAINEALELVKTRATAKFDESIDVAVRLGIDARKSDQNVRGAVVLPNGTGKTVRIAVFAQGDKAEAAQKAGADAVGFEDLAEKMQGGDINYDVVIATPDAMRVVGKLGQILGPRGLMPNPKVGTVAADVVGAIEKAKAGQVRYRNDKNAIIHCSVGKSSFDAQALQQNIEALLADLKKMKPAVAKGVYLKKLSISSTMGVGVNVDMTTVSV